MSASTKKLSTWFLSLFFTASIGANRTSAVPIISDGTTGTVVTPDGQRFDISGGTLSGDGKNLFHSFEKFGPDANQIANFLSNPQIRHILGRVTGGEASVINGLIQVTGGNSNLFLMNPSGIIFGPNASLQVPAAFTATTANAIGFGTGRWFNARGDNNYTNLVGTPSSFAFTTGRGSTPGPAPGAIINTGDLAVKPGKSLVLLGGTVISTGKLSAPSGQLLVSAVPGESYVRISQPGHVLSLEVQPTDWKLPVLSLPELLTGGGDQKATGLTVNSNGTVQLTGSGIPVETGDVVAREVKAQTVTLAAIHNLTLVESQLHATGNMNLLAKDTVLLRDSEALPFSAKAGENLYIQGNQGIHIQALNHLDKGTPFQSGGDMTFVSDGKIFGDSHFASGGQFKLLNLAGGAGTFITLYDPIISSNSDVSLGDYTGASLKVETKGSITAGNITITTPDTTLTGTDPDIPVLTSKPSLILRAGVSSLQNPASTLPVTTGGTTIQSAGYTVTNLGTLTGGFSSVAYGINNSGQVVGESDSDNGLRAFLYSGSQMQDLGTLPDGSFSRAYGINNSGQVVGYSDTGEGDHAFLYSGSQMQDLGTLPDGSSSIAYGINDSGQVVGESVNDNGLRAFLYSGSQMQDLGTLPGGSTSAARGINNSGQVVGYSDTGSGDRAFLYSGSQMQDLGTLPGGSYSRARGINNSGQVVGESDTGSSGSHAFLYSGSQMQDLGTLPDSSFSIAYGINNSGQVVGSSDSGGENHAFLYSGGQMNDLNNLIPTSSGWILESAQAINDSGQIVGNGTTIDGDMRAFLAEPMVTPTGGITVGNISTALGPVILQGPSINLTGSSIASGGGDITFDGATVLNSSTGAITANSGGGNITFNNTLNGSTTGGLPIQNLDLTAQTGNVALLGAVGDTTPLGNLNINSSNQVSAAAITANGTVAIAASNNISGGNITGKSGIALNSTGGNITTLNLDSSSSSGNGGAVALTANNGNIAISTLNSQGSSSGTGGKVDITTGRLFQASGSFTAQDGTIASISSQGGAGGGAITIQHNGGSSNIPFVVGDATSNGTAKAITSGASTISPTQSFPGNYTLGNIRLISTNSPTPSPTPTPAPNNPNGRLPNSESARVLQQQDSPTQKLPLPSQVPSVALACVLPGEEALNSVNKLLPTLAAYMNTAGGSLRISLNDLLPSCGKDLIALPGNQDQIKQHVMALVSESMGTEYANLIKIGFANTPSGKVTLVEVAKAPTPVFVKEKLGQAFYIQEGNKTRSLDKEATELYIQIHWK